MEIPQPNEEAIFEAALQLSPEELFIYLKKVCGTNLELRQRIEMLIAAHQEGMEFMETPAAPSSFNPASLSGLPSEKPGDVIGCYKLLQQIGEGGCGVIYLAEQESPVRRRVALKIIKLGMDTKNVIGRFEAERQALALMDHPNIARVFDAGATEIGRPFFVMELVSGARITKFCDTNKLSIRERLTLYIQICQAVEHAHQKGVIHRDLKPSNILVTLRDGVPVPKVIDFGIAKATGDLRLTDKTVFTAFELFIGTPAYMSPEQAEMSELGIDTRSDIYSLGVLLYELLTGITPFDSRMLRKLGFDEIRRIIREEEPATPSTCLNTMSAGKLAEVARHRNTPPSKLNDLIQGELDWIVMKALEKDRTRRYETANGLAADLKRHLANEPVMARPQTNIYLIKKFVRRHKFAVTSVMAILTTLLLGLALSLWEFAKKSHAEQEQSRLRVEAQKAREDETQLRLRSQTLEHEARLKAYASDMNLVHQMLDVNNLGRAREFLNRERPQPGEEDLRGWEWRYYWKLCQEDKSFQLCGYPNSHIYSLSYSADNGLLAVAADRYVSVWDITNRRQIFQSIGNHNFPRLACFSPNSDLLAYSDETNVVLWDSRSQKEVRRLQSGGPIHDLRFTSDGRLFVTVIRAQDNVQFWDSASGRLLSTLSKRVPDFQLDTRCITTADGKIYACAGLERPDTLSIMDAGDGQNSWKIHAADDMVTAVAFSPDNRLIATGAGWVESDIKLWDRQTLQFAGRLQGHHGWVSCLRFLPNTSMLVSASADQTIRFWDTENHRLVRTLQGETNGIWTFAVSGNGRQLASGSEVGNVVCWDLTAQAYHRDYRILESTNYVGNWCFSSDGKKVATVEGGRVRIYDSATLKSAENPEIPLTNINAVLFTPDDRSLVMTTDNGLLGIWDLALGIMRTNFPAHKNGAFLNARGFSNNGRTLVTFGNDGLFKEWSTSDWQENRQWAGPTNVLAWVLCPATGLVVAGSSSAEDKWVRYVDIFEPKTRINPQRIFGLNVDDVDVSLDGDLLAVADAHGEVSLWNTANASRVGTLRSDGVTPWAVAFSSNGKRVAAARNGPEAIKLWDLDSREEVGTLDGEGSNFYQVKFSPDGRFVGAVNWRGKLHLWEAPSWKEINLAEQGRR